MTYIEALNFLRDLGSFEKTGQIAQGSANFDLDRYRRFLARLGNPEKYLNVIHVAGSKGKGSTCHFISAGLRSQGSSVGLFTSPGVYDMREQIVFNDQWISEEDFLKYFLKVKACLDDFEEGISYFEFVTSVSFLFFRDLDLDYVVLEVGLGGIFDATNVVESPIVTVLTQIELEHANILGNTVLEVLGNKLGIMKSGAPMFVSWQIHDLREEINEAASGLGVECFYMQEDYLYDFLGVDLDFTRFRLSDSDEVRFLKMKGEAYIKSCLTAYSVLTYLFDNFDDNAFWEVASRLQLPARFELYSLDSGAYLVLDMAHTVQGAKQLRDTLDIVFPNVQFKFLLSMLKDKNVDEFISYLLRAEDTVICTQSSILRSLSAFELAAILNREVQIDSDLITIFKKLLSNLQKGDVLVVTGSHYLLQDLYAWGALTMLN